MTKTADGKPKEGSRYRWIWDTVKSLSVEPAGFVFWVSMILTFLTYQNLLLEVICKVDLGYDEEKCIQIVRHLNASYKEEELEIQQVASGLRGIQSLIVSVCNVFLVLLFGAVSDRKGRKITMLIPLGGFVVFCVLLLGAKYLATSLGIPALVMVIIVAIPYSITGGLPVFSMSAFSYIADSTSDEDRTMRTGIMSATSTCGAPAAFAIAGLLTRLGFTDNSLITLALILSVLAFILIVWRVENATPREMRIKVMEIIRGGCGNDKENQEKFLEKDEQESEKLPYNPLKLMWQTLSILFQKRKKQVEFYLLILCYICFILPGPGEFTLIYLFVRERLGWGVAEYGFFSTCTMVMGTLGTFLSMFILSKVLRVRDAWIGLLACLSQISGSLTYAFAKNTSTMFLASAFDMLNGTMGVVVKSMFSKIVEPEDVGKMFSLLGLMDTIIQVISNPAYALLYTKTVGVFTGAIFIASAVITVPAMIVFMYFVCKSPRLQEKTDLKETHVETADDDVQI